MLETFSVATKCHEGRILFYQYLSAKVLTIRFLQQKPDIGNNSFFCPSYIHQVIEYVIAGIGLSLVIIKVKVTVVLESFFDSEDRLGGRNGQ